MKLGRDAVQAMQSIVNGYFSNLLKDLYNISRKRHVGQELKGKLQHDVGLNVREVISLDIYNEGVQYSNGSIGWEEQGSRRAEESEIGGD